MGALSVTGQPKYREGFGPLVDARQLRAVRRSRRRARGAITEPTCAIIVEPIQGEGGVNLPPAGLPAGAARSSATDAGAVLIFDEVQTGVGPHRHVVRATSTTASCPTS